MASTAQFIVSRRMGIFEPNHQIGVWGESCAASSSLNTGAFTTVDNKIGSMDASDGMISPSNKYDQEMKRPIDKVSRRLAQNREAARKSRLRKKAYLQQLESSRVKLAQLEHELESVRRQTAYAGRKSGDSSSILSGPVNPDLAAFEIEYAQWLEEQNKQVCELRIALQQHVSEIELQMLVENGMRHYDNLFHMKITAANLDVFYILFGTWTTGAERCFIWIGGFRPSELLKVLSPQLELLTEQQIDAVCSLQHSCQQAEDALQQGMDRLKQTISDMLSDPLGSLVNYMGQMSISIGKLEALVSFVEQADLLRQQTLHQMHRILTVHQAARGLLVLGDYFQRLRALSSLWAARPQEHS